MLERSGVIGGQVWLAGHGPSHRELAASLTRNYDQRLDRPNVDLRLGVTADADTVAGHEPDVVIVATGARPFESAHHPRRCRGAATCGRSSRARGRTAAS